MAVRVRTFRSALLINGLGAGVVHSLCLELGFTPFFFGVVRTEFEAWLCEEKKKNALKSCGIAWGGVSNGASLGWGLSIFLVLLCILSPSSPLRPGVC